MQLVWLKRFVLLLAGLFSTEQHWNTIHITLCITSLLFKEFNYDNNYMNKKKYNNSHYFILFLCLICFAWYFKTPTCRQFALCFLQFQAAINFFFMVGISQPCLSFVLHHGELQVCICFSKVALLLWIVWIECITHIFILYRIEWKSLGGWNVKQNTFKFLKYNRNKMASSVYKWLMVKGWKHTTLYSVSWPIY